MISCTRTRGWCRVVVLAGLLVGLAVPADAAILKKGYAMCRDQAGLDRLVEASIDNDDATVRELMKTSCRVIAKARKVRILARTQTLAHVAIPKGGTWWTVVEAVQ